MRSFLDGNATLTQEQAVSHHHCDFGKWYYGEGLSRFGDIQALKDVEPPHAELHSLIKKIVEHKHAGRVQEVEAAYEKIDPLSRRIVGLLDEVERLAN